MNSSEIEPRVGMQVKDLVDARIVGIDKDGTIRLVSIEGRPFKQLPASNPIGSWHKGCWEILWVPPTDAERAMFREGANHLRDMFGYGTCQALCLYALSNFGLTYKGQADVCDSLALDGADCDNMPEGYV